MTDPLEGLMPEERWYCEQTSLDNLRATLLSLAAERRRGARLWRALKEIADSPDAALRPPYLQLDMSPPYHAMSYRMRQTARAALAGEVKKENK